MESLLKRVPQLTFALLAAFLLFMAWRSHNETTVGMIASSILIFAMAWASAVHLLGPRASSIFIGIAVLIGWFAEEMGARRGWFFGSYDYTDVLGPRLGEVPIVIPLMWFALVYIGYVIANLIVWKRPVDRSTSLADMVWLSLLTAFIVTAYDLAADPYMVFVAKAWIMEKQTGWWFGETIQGFVGWTVIAFAITLAFRLAVRRVPPTPVTKFTKRHSLFPVLAYLSFIIFFLLEGYPPETRSIAFYAMGIPVLAALAGWSQWQHSGHGKEPTA